MANNIDTQSPVGVSVYSRAVKLIQEADAQYSRILWEYEGSELAIDASVDVLREDDQGRVRMPQRCKRLFRKVDVDKGTSGDLYEVFSPTIRDVSLFNGLDKILKRVEFNCNLAYGTLSDPQNVDKTAEEIRSSKARSYSMVSNIQTALEAALQDLLWAMDFYASLYGLAPRGAYEANFTWGDGVLQDTDKEYARRMDMADRGYLRPEKVISWYFGVSEEEALKYMPERELGIQFQGL
jgi:A118 family predicted phage portal protein